MKIALVTRYSVKHARFLSSAGIGSALERIEWLQEREALFKATCLPSVLAQDTLPDVWMILFAIGDEQVAKQIIPVGCDWIQPIFLPDECSTGESFKNFIDQSLKSYFTDVEDDVLTARLDSDDCIARTYFSDLLVAADKTDEGKKYDLFIFTRGVRWNGRENRIINYKSSPFLATRSSLGKASENIINSPYFNHTEAHSRPHAVVSPDAPAWLQVIHGRNISNALDLTRRYLGELDNDEILNLFGLESRALPFAQG